MTRAKMYTLDQTKKIFKDGGCRLLAHQYENSHLPMPYICNCGKKSLISLQAFKRGGRCKECGYSKMRKARTYTLEYVQKYFELYDCKLLANEYVNAGTVMPYICKCGRYAEICYNSFQQGSRCKSCFYDKRTPKERHSFEFVKACFEVQGCKLLATEYKNAHEKLPYICICGQKWQVRFNTFEQGKRRCKYCRGREAWKTRKLHDQLMQTADIGFLIKALKKERYN